MLKDARMTGFLILLQVAKEKRCYTGKYMSCGSWILHIIWCNKGT